LFLPTSLLHTRAQASGLVSPTDWYGSTPPRLDPTHRKELSPGILSRKVARFRHAIQLPDCSDPVFDTPKLPYLRGLAVAHDGTVYAAANGCRTVIAVPANSPARAIRKTERPWSPTGVAVHGKEVYVLEYVHTPGDNRKEWIPRVCKIGPDGQTTIFTTVQRRNN